MLPELPAPTQVRLLRRRNRGSVCLSLLYEKTNTKRAYSDSTSSGLGTLLTLEPSCSPCIPSKSYSALARGEKTWTITEPLLDELEIEIEIEGKGQNGEK